MALLGKPASTTVINGSLDTEGNIYFTGDLIVDSTNEMIQVDPDSKSSKDCLIKNNPNTDTTAQDIKYIDPTVISERISNNELRYEVVDSATGVTTADITLQLQKSDGTIPVDCAFCFEDFNSMDFTGGATGLRADRMIVKSATLVKTFEVPESSLQTDDLYMEAGGKFFRYENRKTLANDHVVFCYKENLRVKGAQ